MSALEVESSVHYCEHLLYVQRSQRSMLCMLSQQFQKLQGCCDVVKGCGAGWLGSQVSVLSVYMHLFIHRFHHPSSCPSKVHTAATSCLQASNFPFGIASTFCLLRQAVHLPCVASQYVKPVHLLYHAPLYISV